MENNKINNIPAFQEIDGLNDVFYAHLEEFVRSLDLLYPQHKYNKETAASTMGELFKDKYRLVFIYLNNDFAGFGGYFLKNSLSWGKYLYVNDLVVNPEYRGKKIAKYFFEYTKEVAKNNDCGSVRLDTRLERKNTVVSHIKNGGYIFGFHIVMADIKEENLENINF